MTSTTPRSRRLTRAGGFTLLEIMVALLILSIGLLGLASLQATTVRFNHGAFLRSQATSLAYDITDRMRANRDEALTGAYDVAAFPDPAPDCDDAVAGGTVAALDVSGWMNALACALPGGNGRIVRDVQTVTIEISWDESRGEQDPESFLVSTAL